MAGERLRRDGALVLSGVEARKAFQEIVSGADPEQALQTPAAHDRYRAKTKEPPQFSAGEAEPDSANSPEKRILELISGSHWRPYK